MGTAATLAARWLGGEAVSGHLPRGGADNGPAARCHRMGAGRRAGTASRGGGPRGSVFGSGGASEAAGPSVRAVPLHSSAPRFRRPELASRPPGPGGLVEGTGTRACLFLDWLVRREWTLWTPHARAHCAGASPGGPVSLLSDNSHPKQDMSPKKDGLNNGDISVDFGQLKLDGKECSSDHEVSEDWFDAKESVTGVDSSGVEENQIDLDRQNPKFTVAEMKNIQPLQRNQGFLVHVGALCPSVSEADLRTYFQKYQVSEIAIYDSSTNYRYASLAFKKNHDAKMAVEEMNGIEINGKSVNVRLVKTHGECTSPLSSKKSLNNLEKSTTKEINPASSVSALPRTRPRQMVSEQDSELSPLDRDAKKNCKQIEYAQLLPKIPIQFIPPNTLNLRSFTKIIKRLAELHPEVSRDRIIDALQEVRMNHKGFLSGLSISTIVEMTSSVLKNSASH
ncbi:RNA-binding protein 44 [Erethizon dorsatum]